MGKPYSEDLRDRVVAPSTGFAALSSNVVDQACLPKATYNEEKNGTELWQ